MSFRPSDEQIKVIETWDQGLAVIAGAGSGKTTTLVQKCKRLLELRPESRIAAVSFTERSAADIREKLILNDVFSGAQGKRGHWVMTIHGFCRAIVQEYPEAAGLDGQEKVMSESEARILWSRALDRLWYSELDRKIENDLNLILETESKASLESLLGRFKELRSFGIENWIHSDSENPTWAAMARVRELILKGYEEIKSDSGLIDFDDLEIGASKAVSNPEVRKTIQDRFDLFLVDEFQDTNPVQSKIIESVCRPGFSNLCVVGDPKQSIYRFRDADVSLFEDFCEKLPQKVELTLNFRSRPQIIHYVNEVCSPLFEASELTFQSLVPARNGDEGRQTVSKLNVEDPIELAKWLKGRQRAGNSLGSFALLVRRIRGSEKWIRALRSEGISISVSSGGLFWDDPRVRELVALLRFWFHSNQRMSAITFFRSPWVRISDDEIDRWIDADVDLLDRFLELDHPVANALREQKLKTVRPAEVLESLMSIPEVEMSMASSILALWHRVEELSGKGYRSEEIVREISTSCQESRRESEVPPPAGENQLKILTLHGSKGLEFERVILVDFAGKHRSMGMPAIYWDRKNGAYLARRNSLGERDKKDAQEKIWRNLEAKKSLEESKRLFYVAFTRAKEELICVLPKEELDFEESFFMEDNWRAWVSYKNMNEATTPEGTKDAQRLNREDSVPRVPRVEIPEFEKIRPRHSVTEWLSLNQCERLYHWKFILGQKPDREELGGDRAELGSLVHRCLELEDPGMAKEIESQWGSDYFRADSLMGWWEQSSIMNSDDKDWVERELKFEVPILNQALVGAIDRLQLKDHCYELIDFKVSQLNLNSRQLIERYGLQMELYAWALGELEPQSRNRTIGTWVTIGPGETREVQFELPPFEDSRQKAQDFARLASEILNKNQSKPSPGKACFSCPFSSSCADSIAHSDKSESEAPQSPHPSSELLSPDP